MIKLNGFSAVTVALTLILAGCGGGGGGGDAAPGASVDPEGDGSQQEDSNGRESLQVLTPTVMDKVTIDAKVFRPDVAISDEGKALAVWAEEVNGTLRLVAVEGNAEEGTWGSKSFLDDGQGLYAPNEAWLFTQVTMAASGNGMIGWMQSVEDSDKPHLKTIAYSPETGFDSPVDHGQTRAFILGGNNAGDALIMWEMEFAPNKQDIVAAFRPSGATWEPRQNLTDGEVTEEYASSFALYISQIAMNEAGEATLLYKGVGPVVDSKIRKLQALNLEANGTWTGPETFVEGAAITDVGSYATAISETGVRFTGWAENNSGNYQVFGVTTDAELEQGIRVSYMDTDENPPIRLAATYRADGSLFMAAETKLSTGIYPLLTNEVTESGTDTRRYANAGRYLTMASDGNRVITLGRNNCATGMRVRESNEQGSLMSEGECSGGNAKENIELAITPQRAGVFAGIGSIRDESTFPATRQDVVELTFLR